MYPKLDTLKNDILEWEPHKDLQGLISLEAAKIEKLEEVPEWVVAGKANWGRHFTTQREYTKKLFIKEKRKPEIKFSQKYSFGMTDTRDFFIILSLIINDMRIALIIYSTIFPILLLGQIIKFFITYGITKNE